jgi:hypothetical protein
VTIILRGAQPKKVLAVGDLQTPELVQEIWAKGCDCTWEKASRCPCAVEWEPEGTITAGLTTTPRADCPACGGGGWYYYSSQTVRALILQSTGQTVLDARFLSFPGSAAITTLPEHPIKPFDRLTPTQAYWRYTETRPHTGTSYSLRYPVVDITYTVGTEADPKVYETVTRGVWNCIEADSTGEVIYVAGSPKQYVQNVNFTITAGGAIDWTIGGASVPTVGDRLSWDYTCRPRYVIKTMRFLHRQTFFVESGRNHATSPLPHQAVGELDGIGS